jgi:hypothetical protein
MNAKRKKIENLIYTTFDILDPSGTNTLKYKNLFKSMNDKQFDKYMNNMINTDENFYLEFKPFENEPTMAMIKKAAKFLQIPLDEYVYYKHAGNKDNPIRTRTKVPVGYLHIKRLQQLLIKKNSYAISSTMRDPKLGTVTRDDKVASLSNMESFALNVLNADRSLEEFMGARSDNESKRIQMAKIIGEQGFVNLQDLKGTPNSSVAKNTLNVYYVGSGFMTNLIQQGYMTNYTLLKKSNRDKKRINIDKKEHLK